VRAPTDRDLYRLFERSPIGMYRSTQGGSFVYANPALAKLLAFDSVEALLGANLTTDIYLDPSERPRLIEAYRAKGVIDGARVRWKTRDGRVLVVQIFGHVVEDAQGVASFDASVIDITTVEAQNEELRTQRGELERTAHTLEIVLRQAPALYWLTDDNLRVIGSGGAAREILGSAPGRWVGHLVPEVLDDEQARNEVVAVHRRALAGATSSFTIEHVGKMLATTIAPWRRDGVVVGVIGTAIDITATHALERRMVDAQRAESLGVLAGGLAHDFNNLLVAILGNADLGLRDTQPGAPGRAALENIRQAALRAAELTDQLLAYAGRGGVSTARVAPRPLVEELLRISAATMPDNIAVEVDIVPDVAIRGDAAQIRQVFLNLIANARDAIGARGGRIAISAHVHVHDGLPDSDDVVSAPAPGTYVLLEVADDGPGIDRELRRRIFEPFFTTKDTGHGLGLAAVLGIVRAHGGGLRLRSEPGTGVRFHVLWPAAITPVALAAVAAISRTVLVIDDEDLVRDVVARMIEDLGYAALTAPDGPAGIAIVQQQAIDAVLVDLTMPRMDGGEVVAALRAQRPGMPIVLCTGFDRDRKGPIPADAYLAKPFRIETLEQTLAKLLR